MQPRGEGVAKSKIGKMSCILASKKERDGRRHRREREEDAYLAQI